MSEVGANQFDIRIFTRYFIALDVVGVAQLAERQVVALVVAGSNPVSHPFEMPWENWGIFMMRTFGFIAYTTDFTSNTIPITRRNSVTPVRRIRSGIRVARWCPVRLAKINTNAPTPTIRRLVG